MTLWTTSRMLSLNAQACSQRTHIYSMTTPNLTPLNMRRKISFARWKSKKSAMNSIKENREVLWQIVEEIWNFFQKNIRNLKKIISEILNTGRGNLKKFWIKLEKYWKTFAEILRNFEEISGQILEIFRGIIVNYFKIDLEGTRE